MKKIMVWMVAVLSSVTLYAQGDLHIFDIANKDGKITPMQVQEALSQNGFSITLNNDMNLPFQKQFGKTTFKIFTLLTTYHKTHLKELLKAYPKAGVFAPMGVGIYQGNEEEMLHLSFLTADAQAKIVGIDDSKIFSEIEKELLALITKTFPTATHKQSQDSLKESRNLVTTYEIELEEGDDWDEIQENISMNIESGFGPYGFVLPSTLDVNEQLTDDGKVESIYDFYDSYSVCKLAVIYTVAQTRPEASAFAPCTTMVYKKKDENKVVIGFPAVYNWMSSALVEDKNATDVLMTAQKDFESILKEITE